MPSASHRQFIELAVNMPEHEPHVGQPNCSSSLSPASSILPDRYAPTPSKTEIRSTTLPEGVTPAIIGPPLMKIVGMFSRIAAINIPGTILSQLGMQIMPSKQCAAIIVSTESAISSRLGRLYFMPAWPIAMPSSTPMVLNMNGTPPAARTAARTTSPKTFRCAWPGMMSMYELAMAMNGLFQSSSL